jgi:hypothetical protein
MQDAILEMTRPRLRGPEVVAAKCRADPVSRRRGPAHGRIAVTPVHEIPGKKEELWRRRESNPRRPKKLTH